MATAEPDGSVLTGDVGDLQALAEHCATSLFGIVITMNWREHPPPHFHAVYGEHRASIVIADGSVLRGRLPQRQLRLVRRGAAAHRDELFRDWQLTRTWRPPDPIPPTLEG